MQETEMDLESDNNERGGVEVDDEDSSESDEEENNSEIEDSENDEYLDAEKDLSEDRNIFDELTKIFEDNFSDDEFQDDPTC